MPPVFIIASRAYSFLPMLDGVGRDWMVLSAHGHKMGTVLFTLSHEIFIGSHK